MHVLLDDDRVRRLRERAHARGTSVGALVRAAIDRELERDADADAERAQAAAALLAAEPLPVPADPRQLRRELDELWEHGTPGSP